MKITKISFLILLFIISSYATSLDIVSAKELHPSKPMKNNIKFITEINGVKEYHLPNGIKLLLKPNNTIPLVTFSVWYKVGSRNETTGIRGLAHYLEHMMFKGTKKLKKGEISETIQKLGGVYNAFTSSDGTAYYETISPQYLEKVIQIEADRMKGSILAEEEINLERTVVLSELEGSLNNPITLLDQEVRHKAYENHPYKHPTIGYEKDIKDLNSKTMKEFYNKHYNPNNGTIILVGDFNTNNALSLIEKYFGSIKNTNNKQDENIPQENNQNNEKRITIKRSGTFKLLEITYHIPSSSNKDIYPLNIIEEVLITGKKSRLNQTLVEKGLATEVNGGAEANKDPGLFYILVSLTPKASHKNVEKIITREINKLIKEPPTIKEIDAAKNRLIANYLFSLDGTYNQVFNLGYFELINTWKHSFDWTNEITKVTQIDVINALKKYLKKENRTIGYFIPIIHKGQQYEPIPLSISKTQHYSKTGVRDQESGASKNNTENYKQYKYKKIKLNDGSTLIIYNKIDLPVTYISGVIKGGSSLVPKEKELDCQLISRTLEKGSVNYSKENIEEMLDNSGSHLEFTCDEESFKFIAASLNDKLTATVKLLFDVLMNPVFPKKEINKEKNKFIAEIIELKDSTQEIAKRKFTQLIYSKDHPYYSYNFEDDIKFIKNINSNTLLNTHEKIIKNNNLIISIVSNIQDKELQILIDKLNKLLTTSDKSENIVNIPDTLIKEIPKIDISYLKEKPQSNVFLGHAGKITRLDPDFYKLHVANYILGGSPLVSRLAKKIRDDSGLVYSIYSYINASYGKGEFGIGFGTNNNNVDKAIKLVKEEVNNFVKKGITEEELKKAKAALIDSFISRNLSTNKAIVNTLLGIEYYNLSENYIKDYPNIINSLRLNEINQTIKKHIFPDKLNISIAGEYKVGADFMPALSNGK